MPSEVAKELEETLLRWKGVEAQRSPGRVSFTIQGSLFAFLTKKGVVVKLHPRQREDALKVRDSQAYEPQKGEENVDDLVELPLQTARDLNQALPWLRRACRFVRSNSIG
jgi:hypothetical protein